MDKKQYHMYNKDSAMYDKWWTTDPEVIKGFKLAKRHNIIGLIFSLITAAAFIATIIFGALNLFISMGISLILILVASLLAFHFFDKHDYYFTISEQLYFKTKEYETLFRKYQKEEKQKALQLKRDKAKKLVEMYDIISDNTKSKADRINLLIKYME